jgi:hypothetical protein
MGSAQTDAPVATPGAVFGDHVNLSDTVGVGWLGRAKHAESPAKEITYFQ